MRRMTRIRPRSAPRRVEATTRDAVDAFLNTLRPASLTGAGPGVSSEHIVRARGSRGRRASWRNPPHPRHPRFDRVGVIGAAVFSVIGRRSAGNAIVIVTTRRAGECLLIVRALAANGRGRACSAAPLLLDTRSQCASSLFAGRQPRCWLSPVSWRPRQHGLILVHTRGMRPRRRYRRRSTPGCAGGTSDPSAPDASPR